MGISMARNARRIVVELQTKTEYANREHKVITRAHERAKTLSYSAAKEPSVQRLNRRMNSV
jgi:hypothetical protein